MTASAVTAKEHRDIIIRELAKPAWLMDKGITPAQKGTIMHRFMQFCDFSRAKEDPQKELERLVEMNFLLEEEAKHVDIGKARTFLNSSLGKRVLSSQGVQKERRFTAEIEACEVFEDEQAKASASKVILQGEVDCVFEEDGELCIIDFKTDRIRDMHELKHLYMTQLKLYAKAMNQVTGMKVKECYIYSMYNNDAVLCIDSSSLG